MVARAAVVVGCRGRRGVHAGEVREVQADPRYPGAGTGGEEGVLGRESFRD